MHQSAVEHSVRVRRTYLQALNVDNGAHRRACCVAKRFKQMTEGVIPRMDDEIVLLRNVLERLRNRGCTRYGEHLACALH